MLSPESNQTMVLLVRTGNRFCALPLASVVETMRPLSTQPVPGVPPFLRGVAIIRGEPVPVVDLDTLLAGPTSSRPGRFVLLRTGERRVALAVEAVLGVFRPERSVQQGLPPLLQDTSADLMAAMGVRDRELLLVLQAARIVPDEVWGVLESREKMS